MNPQSRIWLCKSNLENDYKNTLTFSSITAQRNYFIGNPSDPTDTGISTKSYSEYTYLRLEQAIKVDDLIDNIDTNNYLVLINNNKYYYYFITSMDYIDEETTKIHIELDVMQTYFFDIEYKQTFVEREHVTDDTPGKHTIPEGLETGDYICNERIDITDTSDTNIIFQVIYGNSFPDINFQYGGVFSGTCFVIFDIPNAIKFIKAMDEVNQRDYITAIFMYKGTIKSATEYTIHSLTYGDITFRVVNPTSTQTTENFTILSSKPTSVGTYTPRNKKLLTFPYCYLLADNNVGGIKPYKYEDFGQDGVVFTRLSTVSVGGSTYYTPRNYKWTNTSESDFNLTEGFAGSKFPVCSWISDSYTNWLTQSGVNREFNYQKDVGQIVLGAGMTGLGAMTGFAPLTMMGAGMMAQGTGETVGDIIKNVQEKKEHQIAPYELMGNVSLGDVMYAYNRSLPIFYKMNIKEEYAKVIDKFFDQFGYQVNILKTPSIHTRSNWNYLKTKSCNFTGDIPQEYMTRIKSIFDKGITFWHKPQYMFDYTQTNNVI